jgi:Flp pilus assembly protein TadG
MMSAGSATHGRERDATSGRSASRATAGSSVMARQGGGRADRGSVTAETAVALPALAFVLVAAVWGVSATASQVACVDAARAGARAAARGEPVAQVRAEVLRAAPPRASVDVRQDPAITRVVVRAVVSPPRFGLFPPLTLRAQAIAATEPR